MARTSRKALNSAIAEQEQTAQSQSARRFNTAAYIRLSDQDSDSSDSLENQENLVRGYIENAPDLKLCGVYSDSITGTVFTRPGFDRLMADIKRGKIDCVVCKDLSRWGRDYIEAGNLIEVVFPQLGVRFIAIGDKFDSFAPRTSGDEMSLALKNMVNSFYAKDISRKSRTAYEAKRLRGDYTGAVPPFGYKRLPDDKTKLVIDEESAAAVRDMFRWRVEGATYKEIAKRLDAANVPNPKHYAYLKGYCVSESGKVKRPWEQGSVAEILNSPTYIGNLVLGKKTAVAMHVAARRPQAEWSVVNNTHEPIVSQADFDAVAAITQRGKERRAAQWANRKGAPLPENIFAGLIFCRDCGHVFTRKAKTRHNSDERDIRYFCHYCREQEDSGQTVSRKRGEGVKRHIALADLEAAIFGAVKAQVAICADYLALAERARQSAPAVKREQERQKELADVQRGMAKIENGWARLQDDYYDGLLTREDYQRIKDTRERDYAELSARLERLSADGRPFERDYWDSKPGAASVKRFIAERFADAPKLTREQLKLLVARIEVDKALNVYITFRFNDEFAELERFIGENGGGFGDGCENGGDVNE